LTTHWKSRFRRLRRLVGYGVAVGLILVASLVGLVSQLLPALERYPDRVAAWISGQSGQTVGFKSLQTRWTRRGPLLSLHDLTIGEPGNQLVIGSADLLVSIYSGLVPGRPLTELQLGDLDLTLTQAVDGGWALKGLVKGDSSEDPLAALQGLGELQVRNAALTLRLEKRDLTIAIPRFDARVRVEDSRVRAGLLLRTADDQPPLAVVADIERSGGGRLWLGGEDIEASALAVLTALAGVEPLAGRGSLQLWADWSQAGFESVVLEADMAALALRGTESIALDPTRPETTGIEPRLAIDRFRASARWRSQAGHGWRLDAPMLRWREAAIEHRYDGLVLGTGQRGGALADSVELSPWLALLSLSDRLDAPIRRWIYLAAPKLSVVDLDVVAVEDGGFRGSAAIQSLGWLALDRTPGANGLAAELVFDESSASLTFDQAATPRLDWPVSLGDPLALELTGALRAWRSGQGFVAETSGLRVFSEGLGLQAALRLDGSEPDAPLLFVTAEVEPGQATALKRFWLRHTMSPNLIGWLDRAITDGRLVSGRVAMGGALIDWPFRDNEGQFKAQLRMEGVPLVFSADWPAADRLTADLTFTSQSVSIAGTGAIGGGEVQRISGSIGDFRQPVLDLELTAAASGSQVLALLRASPLRNSHGEHLSALQLGGRAAIEVQIRQPLRPELGESEVRGTADISNAPLAHSEWEVAFDQADGRIRFSRDGLAAEELRVRLGEEVASFSLATGDGFVSDPALVAEASLRGRLPAGPLLDHAPDLDWLRPFLDGRSDWSVAIEMPRATPAEPDPSARLRITSDLRGIALGLPAPLRKASDQALPLKLQMAIPVTAAPILMELGALMTLNGTVAADGGLDGVVGFIGASEAMHDGRGLRVIGQVPVLDGAGWAGLATGGSESGVLHSVEIRAGELDLLDRAFVDTQIALAITADSMTLDLDGPEIAGRMVFPRDGVDALTGDFQRLHWPSGRIASADTGNPDPTALPPLRLRVEDLRFGDARLGRARLDTYPTPEGLHVERLETDSDMLKLSATGDWTAIGGSSRSRFALAFESEDLGRMLDALSFAGLVEGGETRASIIASWAGSPAAFGLEKIDGTLGIEVGSGRFLDVEPGGAGRLLGLISLAELPRRLILDFGDLFGEGLEFSSIQGSFALANGVATTDDLKIESSSAGIRVRGRTLLIEERYDQTIEVLPKSSSILPALGALAGGPAGVALGALAQAIFKSPMQKMGRTQFRVTGPWSDPQVEVIERGAGGEAATPPDAQADIP
jgi:uncharacterized protein (TIGR02099 family)